MNKHFQNQIKNAFDAPETTRKESFLKTLEFPKLSYLDFIISQLGYIRKRVWILSSTLLILTFVLMYITQFENVNMLWIISSLLPFILLTSILEITKSTTYNIAELEMSCKYSFSNIFLVRLGILCIINSILFTVIFILLLTNVNINFLQLGISMFTPFMLSCTLSLFTIRHLNIRESRNVCCGISCGISAFNIAISNSFDSIYIENFIFILNMLFLLSAITLIYQIIKLIINWEENQWKLKLID